MSSVAGIQLMACASTAGAPGPSHPVTFTTAAQVWVYFGCLGVVCDPKTSRKYRSPGGVGIETDSRAEMLSAGVGVFWANVEHPAPVRRAAARRAGASAVRAMTHSPFRAESLEYLPVSSRPGVP